MKYLLHSLILLPTIVLSLGCERIISPVTILENDVAARQLKNEKVPEAMSIWSDLLQEEPFRPELHLNMGLGYEILKDQEKAFSFYKGAEKFSEQRLDLKFAVAFNQAQLYGKLKKFDEALFYYQKALGIVPTSQEVKINIELLIKAQQEQQKQDKKDKDKKDGQGGEGGDKSDEQKDKDKKDQQDKENKDSKENQDKKDKDEKDKDKDGDKKDEKPKEYGKNPKPQAKPFEGKELTEGDVKKILGELKQQEQKIRANFNRKQSKDSPKDKDW